jgi:hypothetical protein
MKKSGPKKFHPKTNISQICHLDNQKKPHIFNHFEGKKIHELAQFRNPQNPAPNDLERKPFSFQIHFCVLASDISILNLIGAPYLGYYQVNAQSRNEIKIDSTTQQTTTILSLQK